MSTPTVHLTATMKAQAAAYAHRTGAPLDEAATLARAGLLTSDGHRKAGGGKAPKRGTKREHVGVTAAEKRAFERRHHTSARLMRDERGYYVANASRESDRYASASAIPAEAVRGVEGG